MLIDFTYAVIFILAAWHGYRKGLIVGLFSLVAIIIGLAAALKLSVVLANYIGSSINISKEWLPLISFILIFILVLLLVRFIAKAIEKTFQAVMLGWVNRLAGVIFFVVIYTLVFSVLLFYAEQMKLLMPASIQSSKLYPFVQPWGPKVIDGFGGIVPLFKNIFTELENFFQSVADKAG